ncbi:serine hydrolase domain-containing protein [soil metagenome]
MGEPQIQGFCPPQFDSVRQTFAASFAAGEELGAGFALTIDGELVIDLVGGFADRAHTKPFQPDTLTTLFSTTKALAALMIARLVDQGRLTYTQPVAEVWPEFAQAGKQAVTLDQVMSHQEGLPGFPEPMDPAVWFDWDLVCAKLAAMTPMWPPGTAHGYHPVTFGYLVGEVFRRVDGRTLGTALREDIAEPFGLDLWIGLPLSEQGRAAEMMRPTALANFGPPSPALTAAFLTKWASPGGRGTAEWRRVEIPSVNGHATAAALARLMGALACDGVLDGKTILSPGMAAKLGAERTDGRDLVLPFDISWAAGVMRSEPNFFYGPNPDAVGHSGWGGSCAFADPARRLSAAYVMNMQSPHLLGDPRPLRLINAAYGAL